MLRRAIAFALISGDTLSKGPDDYHGGELLVEDTYGVHSVKLPAGHMVLYPSTACTAYSRDRGAGSPRFSGFRA